FGTMGAQQIALSQRPCYIVGCRPSRPLGQGPAGLADFHALFPAIQKSQGRLSAIFKRLQALRTQSLRLKGLARSDSQLCQLLQHCLINRMKRIALQKLCEQFEELNCGHACHLLRWTLSRTLTQSCHIKESDRWLNLRKMAEQCQLIAALNVMDVAVVGGSIGLCSSQKPDCIRRRSDRAHACRQRALPTWPDNRE